MKVCFFLISLLTLRAASQTPSLPSVQGANLCEDVVWRINTAIKHGTPSDQLPRVEVRRCLPNSSDFLQISAWVSGGNSNPPVVLDTSDFFVVQVAARGNVVVIETGGGTTDQVFVITYKHGVPALVLRQNTGGTAEILVQKDKVTVAIRGIYNGDAPDRTESHTFEVKLSDLKP